MNKLMLDIQSSRSQKLEQLGMTLVDSLVAILMLAVFTGVVASVMQFTLRFFSAAESGEQNEFEVANGVLIDHQQIHIALDALVEVLSQPGISLERLEGRERCSIDDPTTSCVACTDDFDQVCRPQIAFDPQAIKPNVACPAARPVAQWHLPMPEVSLPPGYRLCLWKTTALESSLTDLDADVDVAKPGIYLMQALPERLSSSGLPVRRLFCRPRPYC